MSPDRLVTLLGDAEPPGEGASEPADDDDVRVGRRVGRMVARVAAMLPWHPACLPQALATQSMLARRGVPSTLHLGVADVASMHAHAWVTVGEWKVVGRSAQPFTPVASFPRTAQARARRSDTVRS